MIKNLIPGQIVVYMNQDFCNSSCLKGVAVENGIIMQSKTSDTDAIMYCLIEGHRVGYVRLPFKYLTFFKTLRKYTIHRDTMGKKVKPKGIPSTIRGPTSGVIKMKASDLEPFANVKAFMRRKSHKPGQLIHYGDLKGLYMGESLVIQDYENRLIVYSIQNTGRKERVCYTFIPIKALSKISNLKAPVRKKSDFKIVKHV